MLIRSDFLGADCKKSAVTVWTSLPSSRVLSACVLHSCAPSCQLHSVTVPVKRRKKTPFPKSWLSSVFTISSCNHTPIKASSGYDSSINNKNIHLFIFLLWLWSEWQKETVKIPVDISQTAGHTLVKLPLTETHVEWLKLWSCFQRVSVGSL